MSFSMRRAILQAHAGKTATNPAAAHASVTPAWVQPRHIRRFLVALGRRRRARPHDLAPEYFPKPRLALIVTTRRARDVGSVERRTFGTGLHSAC